MKSMLSESTQDADEQKEHVISLNPKTKSLGINYEGKLYESLLSTGFCRIYEKHNELSSIIPRVVLEIITLYLPKAFEIFGVGSNSFGEFSIGNTKQLKYLQNLNWKYCDHPCSIYIGMAKFTIKSIYNEIYNAGCNTYGVCGVGDKNQRSVTSFTSINIPNDNNDHIEVVSNGIYSYTSIICTRNHKFYGCGTNRKTQFGNGYPSTYCTEIYTEIPGLNKLFAVDNHLNVIKIECGLSHTLFLTANGKVFGCGENKFGQCGKPINRETYNIGIPESIQFGDESDDNIFITDISSGSAHNLCLTSSTKDVYSFGANTYGQIGINTSEKKIFKPKLVDHLQNFKIKRIICGPTQSACIQSNGNCYVFGQNLKYQLGRTDASDTASNQEIPVLFKHTNIKDVSINLTHSVFLTKQSNVITCGDNTHNQCSSTKSEIIIKEPHILSRIEIGLQPYDVVYRAIAGYCCTIIVSKKAYGVKQQ